MRITEDVYLVGGGPSKAFGLSADPDCHIYLIDGGSELALIDCGMGTSLDQIVTNIEREGLDIARLRRLILTHYHMDHAGGAARFREHFDLQVWAPREAAAALRTGDERAVALDVAKAAGFYAADYVFEPVAIDRELSEGDRVEIGDLSLEVFDTPGHCHGHASYLLWGRGRRYLFAADAVFAGGRVVLQNIHDCSIQQSAASILKLAKL
ncbi:MAG: MBL fold metallo-hydrolase, partial [Chloroflexia bacterium]|nr:MBL fold metallo-hydrolase [Chloroflexia bacterium]